MGPEDRADAGRGATETDRIRVVYLAPWRLEVIQRSSVPRVLPAMTLARAVARALEAAGAPAPGSVTVVLTDDAELSDLNAEHMGVEGPTDVLSFPMLEAAAFRRAGGRAPVKPAGASAGRRRTHIGDIAISVDRAIEQAAEGRGGQTGDVRWSSADELRLLVTHGTLHLCGWDHALPTDEAAMRALEQRLLAAEEVRAIRHYAGSGAPR